MDFSFGKDSLSAAVWSETPRKSKTMAKTNEDSEIAIKLVELCRFDGLTCALR